MKPLLLASIRQNAVYIPDGVFTDAITPLSNTTAVLVANMAEFGYAPDEKLLRALNSAPPAFQATVWETLQEIAGIDKNWTPLVKAWNKPTNEGIVDHLITWFANVFKMPGTELACGHVIPDNTFPLDRFNGCPFCGTPFQAGYIERYKQNSLQKILTLWTEEDLRTMLRDLLISRTPLDATQLDSLRILLSAYGVPENVEIGIKETLMCVIDFYRESNTPEQAGYLFKSPADIMRYLWFKHTGFLQIIEPRTIVKRSAKNSQHIHTPDDKSGSALLAARAKLKLKYNRRECLMVASWLNGLNMDPAKACEIMHAKRNMWVRFIRALRLAEYSHRNGFEKLAALLDLFYREEYEVWQGRVDHFRLRYDVTNTFELLKQRPGLFARSLFANMLWFGPALTYKAFASVIDKVPARLVFTLEMYATTYFDKQANRSVKPLGGVSKKVAPNALLSLYSDEQIDEIRGTVKKLCRLSLQRRFAAAKTDAKTMFIDPALYSMPLPIGERSETIQDIPSALPGSRFAVEGTKVRLFMQWGTGLAAQHMDMDLSCKVIYDHKSEYCAFNSKYITGCEHSGDIRSIPDKVGTAEYIEIDVAKLAEHGARQVIFTCNAYQPGGITPNLVVGWMNSKYPMHISEKTGVAYDPSCVQHQARVVSRLSKGLVFGVLEFNPAVITWIEMPFQGQLVSNVGRGTIEAMLKKVKSKMSIGEALEIKATAQAIQIIQSPDADEVYSTQWASSSAAVSNLLLG